MYVLVARFLAGAQHRHFTRDLIALFTHHIIMRLAITLTGVFGAVFVFQLFGNSLLAVVVVYGAIQLITFILTPLSSMLLKHWGIRTMILVAVPILAFTLLALYPVAAWGTYTFAGIFFFVIGWSVYKALYWVPYNVDFSVLLDKSTRGRQVATLGNISDFFIAAMPFVAGLIVVMLGFPFLFVAAALMIGVAVIPILHIQNTYESFSWGYVGTLRRLFSQKNRTILLAYVGDGVQLVTFNVIWPLFIFLLLGEKYLSLGIVAALTLFMVLFVRTTTGTLFDRWDKRRLLLWSAIISSSGWMFKLFVGTPFQIVAADTYHGIGRVANRTSIDALAYEQAADNGRYIDEYTALKEMALSIGRAIGLCLAGVVVFIVGDIYAALFVALVVAAVATLATSFLSYRTELW